MVQCGLKFFGWRRQLRSLSMESSEAHLLTVGPLSVPCVCRASRQQLHKASAMQHVASGGIQSTLEPCGRVLAHAHMCKNALVQYATQLAHGAATLPRATLCSDQLGHVAHHQVRACAAGFTSCTRQGPAIKHGLRSVAPHTWAVWCLTARSCMWSQPPLRRRCSCA